MTLADSILSTSIKPKGLLSEEDLLKMDEFQKVLDFQLRSLEAHKQHIKHLKDTHEQHKPNITLMVTMERYKSFDYEIEKIEERLDSDHRYFISTLINEITTYINSTYNTNLSLFPRDDESLYSIKKVVEILPYFEKQLDGLSLFDMGVKLCKDNLLSFIRFDNYIKVKGNSLKINKYFYYRSYSSDPCKGSSYLYNLFCALGIFYNGKPSPPNHLSKFPKHRNHTIQYKTFKVENKESRLVSIRYYKSMIELKFRSEADLHSFMGEFNLYSLPHNQWA